MTRTPIQFVVDDVTYAACYIGERDGQPANRWYCAALTVYIDAPADVSVTDIIAAFTPIAAAQGEAA